MTGMGRVALRALVEIAEGKEPVSHRIELATNLVLRQSTAPPPPTKPVGRGRRKSEAPA
jgi:LacI family transcriptional regulator